MTGEDIRGARGVLGLIWGIGRPLRAAELGRVLRFSGRDPGRYVLDMEGGKTKVSGPVSLALDMMMKGARPPHLAGLGSEEIRAALASPDDRDA